MNHRVICNGWGESIWKISHDFWLILPLANFISFFGVIFYLFAVLFLIRCPLGPARFLIGQFLVHESYVGLRKNVARFQIIASMLWIVGRWLAELNALIDIQIATMEKQRFEWKSVEMSAKWERIQLFWMFELKQWRFDHRKSACNCFRFEIEAFHFVRQKKNKHSSIRTSNLRGAHANWMIASALFLSSV